MATTVKELIRYLQSEEQDQPVFYQYLLAEHTGYSPEEFAQRLDEVSDHFFEGLSEEMSMALADVELETDEDEDDDEDE